MITTTNKAGKASGGGGRVKRSQERSCCRAHSPPPLAAHLFSSVVLERPQLKGLPFDGGGLHLSFKMLQLYQQGLSGVSGSGLSLPRQVFMMLVSPPH